MAKLRKKKKKKKGAVSSSPFLNSLLTFSSNTQSNAVVTNNQFWSKAFKGTMIFVFSSTIILSSFSGINGDEGIMMPFTEGVVEFYTTLGDYSELENYWEDRPNMRWYGAGFELPAGLLASILGLEEQDRALHTLRNILLAILGAFIVLFGGLIARMLSNWRGAFFAALILFLSPRFLGHAFINPRDIPFAFGFLGSAYFVLSILKDIQRPRWIDILGLTFCLGFALSVRSGGALMLYMFFLAFYFGLMFLRYLQDKNLIPSIANIGKTVGIPMAGGFFVGVLLWPYAINDPFRIVLESLAVFSEYPVSIRILFGGELIRSSEVPLSYLPRWIFITAPLAFFAGLILFVPYAKRIFKTGPTYLIICLLVMFLAPFGYVLYSDPGLYDGWRHFIFFYVTGVPVAALGWEALSQWIEDKGWKPWIGPVVLGLLMVEPAVHIARNYQYPYVYFNPLIGGVSGAFGNYELDYWGISTRQGVEALEKKGVLHADMEPIVLATNFRYSVLNWLAPEYRDKVTVEYVRYRERYNTEWDYAIWISRFMDGTHMEAVDWPSSQRTFHIMKVNNTPISAVYERGQPYVFEAKQALDQGRINDAVQLLQQELEWNPRNNMAHLFMGQAYIRAGNWQEAINHLSNGLQYAPDDQNLILNYAVAKINLEDFNEAKRILHHLVEFLPNSHGGWYYLAMANQRTGDLSLAAQYIQNSVQVRPDFRQGWELGIQIFDEIGDEERANLFRQRLQQL